MAKREILSMFKIPRQVRRVYLEAPYDGAWADMVLNPGSIVIDTIQEEMVRYLEAEDKGRIASGPTFRRMLSRCIVDWNLATEDGFVFPTTVEGLGEVEWPLLNALLAAWMAARALPEASAGESTTGSPASAPTLLPGSARRSGAAN